MTDDTEARLAAIEAAEKAAYPGPWTVDLAQDPGASWVMGPDGQVVCEIETPHSHNGTLAFIALARTELSWAADRIRQLQYAVVSGNQELSAEVRQTHKELDAALRERDALKEQVDQLRSNEQAQDEENMDAQCEAYAESEDLKAEVEEARDLLRPLYDEARWALHWSDTFDESSDKAKLHGAECTLGLLTEVFKRYRAKAEELLEEAAGLAVWREKRDAFLKWSKQGGSYESGIMWTVDDEEAGGGQEGEQIHG